ncbi:MAG: Hpt domain-containing protein [Candidatus Obscuribacterales bacterium]|nr:Hpt domain-containing protein [Candidatus Obscuribacterales bacterium]
MESNEQKAKLQESLVALSKIYAQELPARLEELRLSIEKAKQSPAEAAFLLQASSFAHKLKGTAASFGFVSLGKNMTIIEALLLELISDENPKYWQEIDVCLHNSYQTDID